MMLVQALNAVLAFAVELFMLWAYGVWGWQATSSPYGAASRWLMALAAPAIAIALWARWGAPKSSTRLRAPWLYVFEWSMFAGAALALHVTGRTPLAAGYLAIASANLAASAYFARTTIV